jgi:uncharacterized protein (DUF934 family)
MGNADIVIDRKGQKMADAWVMLEAEASVPGFGPVIVPLARLLAEPGILDLPGGVGAVIGPEDDVADLAVGLPRSVRCGSIMVSPARSGWSAIPCPTSS